MKKRWYALALSCFGLAIIYGTSVQLHKHSNMQAEMDGAREYRIRAERGDLKAQYELGLQSFEGKGASQDYEESERWYRKAADQGYAPAQSALGFMSEQGLGVSKDYTEALMWYRKAADQGNADAEYNLGTMYCFGMGVSQDYAEALKWYRMASSQGNANGQYGLGYMYYNGKGVQQDSAEAARLYREASDEGLARAQYDLAYMYYNGRGVAQDRSEGDRLLHQAAAQGEARAQRSLGVNDSVPWGWRKVVGLIIFLGCLFFLMSSLVPHGGRKKRSDRTRILTATVGMAYAGLDLYLSFSYKIHHLDKIGYEISLATNMLLAIFSAMMILILIRGWPRQRLPWA